MSRLLTSDNQIIIKDLITTKSFKQRAKGLLFTKELPPQKGLHIIPCSAVHTFFMRYSLDLIFLNKKKQVVRFIENVKPWRLMVSGGIKAYSVIEVETGWIKKDLLFTGIQLQIK